MPRMISSPSQVWSLRSSLHLSQIVFGSSPGLRNILAMMPSKTPLWSSIRNQPVGCLVSESTACHKPTGDHWPGFCADAFGAETLCAAAEQTNGIKAATVSINLIRIIRAAMLMGAPKRFRAPLGAGSGFLSRDAYGGDIAARGPMQWPRGAV